jgi:hypothetical protein
MPAGSVMNVISGPECGEGYSWWQVRYNGTTGWTVAGSRNDWYLEPLDERIGRGGYLLRNGRGRTNGARVTNGEFQVEYYCSAYGYAGQIRRDNNYWYCGNFTLRQHDFNIICQDTYNNPRAWALQNGNSNIRAFNWRCYGP